MICPIAAAKRRQFCTHKHTHTLKIVARSNIVKREPTIKTSQAENQKFPPKILRQFQPQSAVCTLDFFSLLLLLFIAAQHSKGGKRREKRSGFEELFTGYKMRVKVGV